MKALADAVDGDDRAARIAWSSISEPLDEAAAWLVDTLGAAGALKWVHDAGADPVAATVRLAPFAPPQTIDRALAATQRWLPRMADVDPLADLHRAASVGVRVVARGDAEWPASLDVLGAFAPHVLWARGSGDLATLWERTVAVVGSRASTSYGEHVAAEIAGGISDSGVTVVSGGAYGIDAAAHRAALTGSAPTLAVMAGGVDRLYPAGHTDLLTEVMKRGAVMSEVPVGFAPHRSRFLARNRLIAAADATCVVEAAARSGALSTVNHALRLGRPVGAVPGPVTSVSSGGCHLLIRDGLAVLVRSSRDVLELAGPIRVDDAIDAGNGFGNPMERAAYDAIAPRGSRADAVARASGLTISEALGALGGLELAGLATVKEGVWRRSPRETA
jgi:DNA processing protein